MVDYACNSSKCEIQFTVYAGPIRPGPAGLPRPTGPAGPAGTMGSAGAGRTPPRTPRPFTRSCSKKQ